MLKKLLNNRKGTAEIIGSVMFIVILLFFFTNVYLWHDAATKEMNELYVQKMNSGMGIQFVSNGSLIVTDNGGLDIVLSRLWIVSNTVDGNHLYVNLEPLNLRVLAGQSIQISFEASGTVPTDSPVAVDKTDSGIFVYYPQPAPTSGSTLKFTIVNSLGLVASTYR